MCLRSSKSRLLTGKQISLQTCHESRKHLSQNPIYQSFLYHTCELLSTIATCIKHVLPERQEAFPQNLATEWKEFFSQGAYSLLLPLYIQCTGKVSMILPSYPSQEFIFYHQKQKMSLCQNPRTLMSNLTAAQKPNFSSKHLKDSFFFR